MQKTLAHGQEVKHTWGIHYEAGTGTVSLPKILIEQKEVNPKGLIPKAVRTLPSGFLSGWYFCASLK